MLWLRVVVALLPLAATEDLACSEERNVEVRALLQSRLRQASVGAEASEDERPWEEERASDAPPSGHAGGTRGPLRGAGPLFEQCRARRRSRSAARRVGEDTREGLAPSRISLLDSSNASKAATSCIESEVPLLRFSMDAASLTCCPAGNLACAGCQTLAGGTCAEGGCAGGFLRTLAGRCEACRDMPGFVDPKGRTCKAYETAKFCEGGSTNETLFGQQMQQETRASLANYRHHGLSAKDACCACGGGMRAATPFVYLANTRSFALGRPLASFPRPRTAEAYRVMGAFEGTGCDLHTVGLRLDPFTGAVTGTPEAQEPMQLECQVEAVQDASRGLIANSSLWIDLQWFAYPARVLSFPVNSQGYLPEAKPGATYSDFKVACTPHLPWLSVDATSGALVAAVTTWTCHSYDEGAVVDDDVACQVAGTVESFEFVFVGASTALCGSCRCCKRPVPPGRAGACTVTAWNGTASHQTPIVAAWPAHWGGLRLVQLLSGGAQPVVAGSVDLVVGHVLPALKLVEAFLAVRPGESSEAMPPVSFYAQCDGATFDATTGDIVLHGHTAFRLHIATGELGGMPNPGVLGPCAATARCKVSLSCTFFGELALQAPGATPHMLSTHATFHIRDDTCWQLVPAGEARWKKLMRLSEPASSNCRERCRQQASCSAYQEQSGTCWMVRRVSETSSCPERCSSCSDTSCVEAGGEATRIPVIGGALWEFKDQHDCDGFDITRIAGRPAWDGGVQAAVEGRRRCAMQCLAEPQCKGFNYPRNTDDYCFLKRVRNSQGEKCGTESTLWTFYSLVRPRCGNPCQHFCSTSGTCSSDASGTVDCRGCNATDFNSAFVRVGDCRASNTCLSLTKLGGGAAFLEGEYCPPADGESDGALPYYARQGQVPSATLYLVPWLPAREVDIFAPCQSGTTWVVRRWSDADFTKGSYAELRGEVLACISGDELAPSGTHGPSWSIADAVLDEIRSGLRMSIVDADYQAMNYDQVWTAGGGMQLVGERTYAKTSAGSSVAFAGSSAAVRRLSVRVPQHGKALEFGFKWGSSDNDCYCVKLAGDKVSFRRASKQLAASFGYQVGDTFIMQLEGSTVSVLQNGLALFSYHRGSNNRAIAPKVWAYDQGAQLEILSIKDEAALAPVARTCPNPLSSRRKAKKSANEEATVGEGGFVFHDLDAPAAVKDSHSLSACECFGGNFGPTPPVTDEAFSKVPPGSDNTFVPSSQLLVSGSFSCQAKGLMVALGGVGPAGCEMACKGGEHDLGAPIFTHTGGTFATDGSSRNPPIGLYPSFAGELPALGGALTMAFKARFDNVDRWARIVDIGDRSEHNDNIFIARHAAGGDITFSMWVDGDRRGEVKAPITEGQEQSYLCSVSSSGLMRLWQDGQLVSEHDAGVAPRQVARPAAYLGRSNWDDDRLFRGSIRDFRLWSEELNWDRVASAATCQYYFVGSYTDVEVCRLYGSCTSLAREVNSEGELFAVAREEACQIADPERCWAEVKREKYLAGGEDLGGPKSDPDCLHEHLLRQCDEALLYGGHGVSTCGKCEYMAATAPSVALSKQTPDILQEASGKSVSVDVKDVSISDKVQNTYQQSVFADADNGCSQTRWEMEVPASESGTPYIVEITYGDSRTAVSALGCKIGTMGHMVDASHPEGIIAKNQFRTVSRTIYIHGDGKGRLVFSGEAAGQCSGVNKIAVSAKDRVSWADCGTDSFAWDLRASTQNSGNHQLRLIERGEDSACVDPSSGDLQDCAPESDVAAHARQLFTPSYLPVLLAKWTHFASGLDEQPGACVRASGSFLRHLAVEADLSGCVAQQALTTVAFRQDTACGSSDYYRYFYTCTNAVAVGASAACVTRTTRCVAHTKLNAHLWELDKHNVGAECLVGTVLRRFKYRSCGERSYQYEFSCCPVQGLGVCSDFKTEWGEVGQRSDLSALSHHRIACPQDHGLQRFLLEAQVPEVAAGELLQGEVRYVYSCCALPLAPPIELHTGPLEQEKLSAWEGIYCPRGRTEGAANFEGPDAASLGLERLSGRWCLKPRGGGETLCSFPVAGILSPVQLSSDESPRVEYTPLLSFSTQYKGLGASEVEREEMSQSLLTGMGSTMGGGIESKSFKKLPKIPKAKFELRKLEKAEWAPFAGARAELQHREVTEEVLNWAPDAVQYTPHCLARKNRDMIMGITPYDGTNLLTTQERSKDVVNDCWFTLGVNEDGSAATETWGERGTPGKEETNWYYRNVRVSRTPGRSTQTVETNPTFPGLTEEAVWDCSYRAINRDRTLAEQERAYGIAKAVSSSLFSWVSKGSCMAIPGVITVAGAIAAYAGVENHLGDICNTVASAMNGIVNFGIAIDTERSERRTEQANRYDCSPVMTSMAKMYCDLSCVEDATKKGDQQILDSIGTLNHNILSEMKSFFDHYAAEIFTRLTHMEDKSSHQAEQLKKVMDTYAKAEIDAVNSNGKQLTATMDMQHSALNKNLGTAAKQIFGMAHGEHQQIAEKIDTHLEATTDAIDRLQESTSHAFTEAFEDFTEQLQSGGGEALLQGLRRLGTEAQASLRELGRAAERGGLDDPRRAQRALTALRAKVAGARAGLVAATGQRGAGAGPPLLREPRELHRAVNETAAQLLAASRSPQASPHLGTTAELQTRTAKLLQASRAVAGVQRSGVARLGRRVTELRWALDPAPPAPDHHAELVRFDKAVMHMRRAVEQYLDDAVELPQHMEAANALMEQYVGECSADFDELSFAVQRAMAASRQATKAVRVSLRTVAQQVGLLADILADGDLLRSSVQAASMALASAPPSRPPPVMGNIASKGLQGLLQHGGLWLAALQDLGLELQSRLPARLLGQAFGAFRLAEELSALHEFHGLGRTEEEELVLMQDAGGRLQEMLAGISSAAFDPQDALGKALASRLDASLAVNAPPPLRCVAALAAEGWGAEGWAAWDVDGEDGVVLLRGAARLAQLAAGKGSGTALDLAEEASALRCPPDGGLSALRRLARGELRLCPVGTEGASCAGPLPQPPPSMRMEHAIAALLGPSLSQLPGDAS